jgi:hypothetical protein
MDTLAAGHDPAVQMIDASVVRVHQNGVRIADNGHQDIGRSRGHWVPIASQTLHDDSEAAPDRPTGKNCSDRPCRTTLTGSWTVAGRVSALSRNQDPEQTSTKPNRSPCMLLQALSFLRMLTPTHP